MALYATLETMKVVILYRPESEQARAVETFMHDFKARNAGIKVEVVDVDSRDGIAMASLYDVMQKPAILAMADDGSLLKYWIGEDLPLIDEVASYAYAS
jgi:hypothetical protein